MASVPELHCARDMCLGAKHFRIDRPSTNAGPMIAREVVARGEVRAVLLMDQKYDLLTVVFRVTEAWRVFLRQQGLESSCSESARSGSATRNKATNEDGNPNSSGGQANTGPGRPHVVHLRGKDEVAAKLP